MDVVASHARIVKYHENKPEAFWKVYEIARHPAFSTVIVAFILLNTVLLGADHYGITQVILPPLDAPTLPSSRS
jgi:hypothetical protein